MSKQNFTTMMDQKIFELGLPVTAVSVYLLCVGLADQGELLTQEKIEMIWNSGKEELDEGIEILIEYGILERSGNGTPAYRLISATSWKKT